MSLTLEKIFEAKNRIAPYTTRTPLIRLEKLDEYLGCQVYLKAECMQITGAFKLRGAVNKLRDRRGIFGKPRKGSGVYCKEAWCKGDDRDAVYGTGY